MRCAVYGCDVDNQSKDFTRDIKFFSFPKDKKMQGIWKRLCGRSDDFNVTYARICSKHFNDSDYERNMKHELLGYVPKRFRPLKKAAIPSKFLSKPGKDDHESDREQRREKRQRKKLVESILKEADFSNGSNDDGPSDGPICDNVSNDDYGDGPICDNISNGGYGEGPSNL